MGFAWRCAPFAGPRLTAGAGQGVVLAATFAVSHNVREAKPLARGALVGQTLDADLARRDWGLQQARPQGGSHLFFGSLDMGREWGREEAKTERKKCQSVGVFSTLFRWTHHGLP